jgi:hypothetical protein
MSLSSVFNCKHAHHDCSPSCCLHRVSFSSSSRYHDRWGEGELLHGWHQRWGLCCAWDKTTFVTAQKTKGISQSIPLTLSPFFRRFLLLEAHQKACMRLGWMEPHVQWMELLSCWQQHWRCVRERWGTTSTFKKQTQHINCTYHFGFPMASPAIPRQSMCAGKGWMAGADVRLTATLVPSRGTCGFMVMAWAWWLLGWWGCLGRRAERSAEGSRCFQHWNQWTGGDMADIVVVEAFLSWWNENEVVCMQIKRGEGRERKTSTISCLQGLGSLPW